MHNCAGMIMTEDLKNKCVFDWGMFDGDFRTHFLPSLYHQVLSREHQFSLLATLVLENQQSCFHVSFLFASCKTVSLPHKPLDGTKLLPSSAGHEIRMF